MTYTTARRFGLVTIVLLLTVTLIGSNDPHAVDLQNRLSGASLTHPLGTDHLGRDLATRLAWGALPSLLAIGIVLTGGIIIGLLAGSCLSLGSGSLRHLVSWFAQTAITIPTLVTALVLSAAFGAGTLTIAMALLLTSWAPYALTIGALFDRIRAEPYWQASRAMGVPGYAAVYSHLLPNAWPTLGAMVGADAGRAVIVVASLGFIGLSADTGRPEWGAMILEYRMFLFTEPRLVLAPVAACAAVAFLLNTGLDRDATRYR
ncbi:ABC transporter permease [Granulosicoccus sp. 3-233]|uniref:ABC transporter permease n=1 Tax=Granulosicoccus sp. 3-233 TaxID=3417969 RepID=UPI003D341BB4